LGDFILSKINRTSKKYSEDFKLRAVKLYLEGDKSYKTVALEVGMPSPTPLKDWVNRYREGRTFEDKRGKHTNHRFNGFHKTKFVSIEEERDYLKAQLAFLKKRYQNLNQGGKTPKESRFEIIEEMKDKYPITILVKIAEVSRSCFYKWRKSAENQQSNKNKEEAVKSHIHAIHSIRPYYGYPRITDRLREEGLIVNHKKVYRLMKELEIKSVIRKKRKYFGRDESNVYPNLLNRQFKTQMPKLLLGQILLLSR